MTRSVLSPAIAGLLTVGLIVCLAPLPADAGSRPYFEVVAGMTSLWEEESPDEAGNGINFSYALGLHVDASTLQMAAPIGLDVSLRPASFIFVGDRAVVEGALFHTNLSLSPDLGSDFALALYMGGGFSVIAGETGTGRVFMGNPRGVFGIRVGLGPMILRAESTLGAITNLGGNHLGIAGLSFGIGHGPPSYGDY